ncbi:MAG: hypothetical protein ACREJM_03320 [Candidatus Saccharimonadales bacterium]
MAEKRGKCFDILQRIAIAARDYLMRPMPGMALIVVGNFRFNQDKPQINATDGVTTYPPGTRSGNWQNHRPKPRAFSIDRIVRKR